MAGRYEKNIITDFRPEPDRPKFYGDEDKKKKGLLQKMFKKA